MNTLLYHLVRLYLGYSNMEITWMVWYFFSFVHFLTQQQLCPFALGTVEGVDMQSMSIYAEDIN